MNSLRFSGSACALTCSALTVVPRITNMSTPASTTALANSLVRCGLSEPATVTPASRICRRRCVISSARIGSAYISCIRRTAGTPSSSAISARRSLGSSYRVQRPSRLSTPRPPKRPRAMAVSGDITESIGAAMIGSSKR